MKEGAHGEKWARAKAFKTYQEMLKAPVTLLDPIEYMMHVLELNKFIVGCPLQDFSPGSFCQHSDLNDAALKLSACQ